LTSIIHHNQPK